MFFFIFSNGYGNKPGQENTIDVKRMVEEGESKGFFSTAAEQATDNNTSTRWYHLSNILRLTARSQIRELPFLQLVRSNMSGVMSPPPWEVLSNGRIKG